MITLPLIAVLTSLVSQESAPTPASLTVSADLAARFDIDGQAAGSLKPGAPLRLETTAGDHELLVTPEGGGPVWRRKIFISSALPASVTVPLKSHLLRSAIQQAGSWKDERTSLTWAAADSGAGVTLSQAHTYCRALTTGGFGDWRLPAIDEVQTLFGGSTAPVDERGYRLRAPLKLSGWSWSSTQGNEPAENWTLDLGDGARASVAAGDAGLNRALCVRFGP